MLGIRIRELRNAHFLSQPELARQLHVSKQSISNWENDNIQPSIEMLLRLANLFNVSTDYLLGLDDIPRISIADLTPDQQDMIQMLITCCKATNAAHTKKPEEGSNNTCLTIQPETYKGQPEGCPFVHYDFVYGLHTEHAVYPYLTASLSLIAILEFHR